MIFLQCLGEFREMKLIPRLTVGSPAENGAPAHRHTRSRASPDLLLLLLTACYDHNLGGFFELGTIIFGYV